MEAKLIEYSKNKTKRNKEMNNKIDRDNLNLFQLTLELLEPLKLEEIE